jgi:hypothetical protein
LFADHHLTPQDVYQLDLRQSARPITAGRLRAGGTSPQGDTIAFTNYYLTYNGHPALPVMGEFHFSRFPRRYWEQELQKMRAGGISIVATYIFWLYVEEEEGQFDWSGDRDVRAFITACQAQGLQVLLRIGPFAHGEFRNGGLPDWLYGQPFDVRSNDERYLSHVRRYYTEVAAQVQGLFFQDGGPIIGIQIENEYMHAGAPWEVTFRQGSEWVPAGSDGDAHMLRLKQLASELGLVAPFYSCTGWLRSPVPEGEFLPMHGGYAFQPWSPDPEFRQAPTHEFLFRDRHAQPLANGDVPYDAAQYPYACCELGGGIQITYHHRPIVPPECVQAMAIIALGSGANVLGYYMYHGGSNPVGKHAYLNEFTVPRISYDFQAPIGEYGQLHQSYHHLRTLHLFLQDFGSQLAPMMVTTPEHAEQITPEQTETLRFAVRSKDGAGFLFLNNYQDHVSMPDHDGVRFQLQLPEEVLTVPQMQGLTLRQGVSAILPFNLSLDDGVRLKYATSQLLTALRDGEQSTYVFFTPEGMHTEFALDKTTYQTIEVTGGTLQQDQERDYILAEPGLHCRIQITTLNGSMIQLLVLTQEQAWSCWKVQLWGHERLLLTDALVICENDELHLTWRGPATTSLDVYPPLSELADAEAGELATIADGFFSRYTVSAPERGIELPVQQLRPNTLCIELPATLDGLHDAFLNIDFVGDMGHAYLNGRLVSDHFANGLPWEIGLKRFVSQEAARELIVRLSPLRSNAAALRYFPTGMAFRPTDGDGAIEVKSIQVHPEYHVVLTQRHR